MKLSTSVFFRKIMESDKNWKIVHVHIYKIFKLHHTKSIVNKMQIAQETLKAVQGELKTLEEKFNLLALKKVNKKILRNVFTKLFPNLEKSTQSQNKIEGILQKFELNDNNAFPSQRGTGWNLLNAITNWTDHERESVRGTNGKIELIREKTAESSMFGVGDSFKSKSLEYILSECEHAETMPEITYIKSTAKSQKVNNILSMVN